ncbi:MAG: extracellular solute-binding protein [Eubacterium sp.]|nr:extracellular solute-binding protein [Eubacterium sp.]
MLKKKLLCMVMALMLLSTGCGKNNSASGEDGVVYEEDMAAMEASAGSDYQDYTFNSVRLNLGAEGNAVYSYSSGDSLYVQLMDQANANATYTLYSYKEEGDCQIVNGIETTSPIQNMYVAKDGSIYYRESADAQNIKKVDSSGALIYSKAVNELLDGDSLSDCFLAEDASGNLLIFGQENLFVKDKDLNGVKKLSYGSSYAGIADIAFTKDGNVIIALDCGGFELNFDLVKLKSNYAGFEVVNTLGCPYNDFLLDGYEADLYIKEDDGIYTYNLEDKSSEKILDYKNSYLNSDEVSGLIAAKDHKFYTTCMGQEGPYIIELFEGEADITLNKEKIKLGTMSAWGGVLDQVAIFNRSNEDYYIDIIEYYNYEDPYAQIGLDLASGEGPDIWDMEGFGYSVRECIDKGLLEGLNSYIEKDEAVSKDDIIESVYDAMTFGDEVYFVSPNFSIKTLISTKELVGDRRSWSFEDLMDITKKNRIKRIDSIGDEYSILMETGQYELLSFIDEETHTCSFDSDEFIEFIEFCKDHGDANDKYYPDGLSDAAFIEQNEEDNESFKKGHILLDECEFDFDTIQINEGLYGDDIVYIGYPLASESGESGNTLDFREMYAISSKSNNKEAAWQFVGQFLTKEYQLNHMEWSMPSRKDCFEEKLRQVSTTEPYTAENGQLIEPINNEYEVNGAIIKKYPATDEQIEIYREVLADASYIEIDFTVMNIVGEELEYYFSGDKKAKEVASIIQSRVQTYLSETQ